MRAANRPAADLIAMGKFRQRDFECAVQQIVGILDATIFGRLNFPMHAKLGKAPRRFIRDADGTYLAGLDEIGQYFSVSSIATVSSFSTCV